MENYSLISEKDYQGLTYTAWRSDIDPKDVKVTCSDGSIPVFDDFNTYWKTL